MTDANGFYKNSSFGPSLDVNVMGVVIYASNSFLYISLGDEQLNNFVIFAYLSFPIL